MGGFIKPPAAPAGLTISEAPSGAIHDRQRSPSGTSNPHELLDYGSDHPVMRMFFQRAFKELESKLPQPIGSRFESLIVPRQPGA
jgi:hypothetical protein